MVATIYHLTTITEYGETRTASTAFATVWETGSLLGSAEAYSSSSTTTYPEPTWRSSTTSTPPPASITNSPPEDNGGELSPGAIAGIAAGSSVAGIGLLLVAIYFTCFRNRNHDGLEVWVMRFAPADCSDPFDIDSPAVATVPTTVTVTPYTFPTLQPPELSDKPSVAEDAPPAPPPVPPKSSRVPRPVPPRPIARTTLEKMEAERRRPSQTQAQWQPATPLERQNRVDRGSAGGRQRIEKRPDNLRVQNPDSEPDPTPPPYDPAWSEGRH